MTPTRQFLTRENDILKQLVANGFFWINYSSTDCDGCSSERAIKYETLKQLYDDEISQAESADGPFRYMLARQYPDGTFDLVKSYNGGSHGIN